MDFSTPKAPPAIVEVTPQLEDQIEDICLAIDVMDSSTPELPTVSTKAPIREVHETPCVRPDYANQPEIPLSPVQSPRRNMPALEIMETQVAVHDRIAVLNEARPKRPAKRKLTKLERELGLGSSRFIVGARNYITPERVEEPPRRRSDRLSQPLQDISVNLVACPVKHINQKLISTPRNTRTIKIVKKTVCYRPVRKTKENTKPKTQRRAKVACPGCRRAKKRCTHRHAGELDIVLAGNVTIRPDVLDLLSS